MNSSDIGVGCNICVCNSFVPGPNGRMSGGMAPMCSKCFSLERHRSIRLCYEAILVRNKSLLGDSVCLQFAKDVSVNPEWFRKWDYSEYGDHNSMNIMDLSLEVDSVDWFVLNHILEHVSDDKLAIRELTRCCSTKGVIQITVPSPLWHFDTEDWGYPDPQRILHYREYGADLSPKISKLSDELWLVSILALPRDPVTNIPEAVFFLCKSKDVSNILYSSFTSSGIISIRLS